MKDPRKNKKMSEEKMEGFIIGFFIGYLFVIFSIYF
jgi:hypothetical protein